MNRKIIKLIPTTHAEFEAGNILLLDSNSEPKTHHIKMKSTASNFTIKTKLYQPNACKKILMCQSYFSDATLKKKRDISNFINVSIRVYTDTNEYYYNGTSWVISTSLWCTEKQACENLYKLTPPDNKKFGFIIKIEKGGNYVIGSPIEIEDFRILLDCRLNHTEDYLYKTFCNKVETECQGQSRIIFSILGSKFNFADLITESGRLYKNSIPFEIYNLTTDPNENNNLFSSYNSVNGDCQLNTSITQDSELIVYFKYNPTVQVTKSVDYYELASMPCITVFDFQEMIKYYAGGIGLSIFNNDTGEGYTSYEPKLCDYEFQAFIDAKSNYDYLYLKEAFQKWIIQNILLRTWGLDEQYDMMQVTGFDDGTIPSMSDTRHGIIRIQIQNVILYELDSYQDKMLQQVIFDLKKKE